MLLAFILCFSTLPMTAFAQEADAVTEQEEQQETDSAEEQEKQQEADSAEEQKEAEAAAAPGEETPSDKSTTVGEAPDTVEPSVESVSDSDAGTQDTAADDEKKAAVKKVQALIDALPDEVTVENAESVGAQLEAIDDAMAELTEEQREELDMTRLYAISEALNTPMTVPMTVAEGKHTDHPICGATCTDGDEHGPVTDWQPIGSETELKAATEGHYYLTQDIETTGTWKPNNNVVLCLNGHSIAANADADAITVPAGSSFTLTDCNSSGGEHYFAKNTEKNNLWEPVKTGGDTTVTGGVITHSRGKNGSGISMGEKGTFTMYGGTICGNYNEGYPGAGVRAIQSTIIMSGGAISGNVAANYKSDGGGVYLYGNGSSFDMSGNAQITDNATNKFGGGVNVTGGTGGKASFTMSGNAQITGNMCFGSACGGAGVYASGGEFTMNGNAAISDNHSKSESGSGGGVFVAAKTTFTMNDSATISKNSAYIDSSDIYRKNSGGGVQVFGGTFIMNGGSIRDNMAESGAGVYVGESGSTLGTFTMKGGTITNNKVIKGNGGGVYVLGTFEIANGAQVLNNLHKDTSGQDTSGQDTSNNVYLPSGKKITIDEVGLETGASIGVTYADTITTDTDVTVATGADNGWQYGNITSDDPNYKVWQTGNDVKLTATKTLQEHPICGGICTDGNHSNEVWKGISDLSQITSDGNYYLTKDVQLTGAWYFPSDVKNVKLCLHGKTITGAGGYDIIIVGEEKSLDITDCQESIGKITHASGNGRGITVKGTLTLWNGDITGNNAGSNGGGVYVSSGSTFTMNGGTITKNDAGSNGGGVYVSSGSTFAMNGGTIAGNNAGFNGGGVYVSSGSTFAMNGGTIAGNNAGSNGGGVCLYSDSTFTMNGGIITGNNSTNKSYKNSYSGGVYVSSRGSFIVSGEVNITNNWKNGTQNDAGIYEKNPDNTDSKAGNVYLDGVDEQVATITIGAGLTEKAKIGVSKSIVKLDEGKVYIIATGATDENKKYNEIFTSDVPDKYFITSDGEGNLYLSMHQHSLTYVASADGKTITATCKATGCPNRGDGGSVIIEAPDAGMPTYDGNAKKAKVTAIGDWLGTAVDEITISYKDADGKELTSAPTDAGTYTASITVGGKTASVTYEIQKATPTTENFVFTVPGSLTYDGMAKTADIKTATIITGMGDVTVKYYQGETEVQPINAGDYKVKISVAAGSNFNAARDLTDEKWAFKINRIITEPTVELNGNTTYTGKQITPDVTVTIDGKTLTADTDYTVTYGDNVNAGTNAGSVTVTAMGNYGFTDFVKNFTIKKADPELSFEKSAVTKTYSDRSQPFTNSITRKGDGKVTYSSKDTTVATVDENTGKVTIVGVGTAVITATVAATENYEKGSTSYTLTVNKARLVVNGVIKAKDKTYDGTTDADVEVSFADENNALLYLKPDKDYTVRGTFSSPNASDSAQTVKVEITLMGDCAEKYTLENDTYKAYAYINAKPISIATALTQGRSYERNNTSVTILGVTFKDSTDTTVTTLRSSDYTMTGKMVNANVGTDKKVTVTVTLQGNAADNYKLVSNTTTAKVAITQAMGGVLQEENLKQKFSDRKQKTFTPDYTGLPAGETWTYSISEAQTSGTAKVESVMINTAGKIAYRLTAGAENDTIRWTVTISNPNYKNFTKDLVLKLTAKDPQETLRITGDNTVAYGQKLQLSTVGGSGTGEITYSVDAGSTGDATIDENGILTPVKVGSVVITATKAGDVDYSEITSAPFVIMITQAATSGEPKYHKITTGGMTLADAGLTLAGSTIHPADGILKWVDDNDNVLPDNTAVEVNKTYKWRFIPADTNYEILTGEIELYHVEAPAVTAQPKSVSVTVGDTATFEVAATGTDVTYQWQIDRNDSNGFVNITGATGATYTTGVTDRDCNGFKYRCVLSNAADSVITDTVVLTVQYQIIEGANGSWNQNTNGGSLRIRGNGEFSKFQNVKVDGNIIDSKNYTASEGSTIIELHADYLKTLSEGSHTFEIVWTDGAAGTGFTVARNTSGSNSTGSNNTGNNDNNDSTDNSAAAAPTAAATAQELDKVPATGDASGIWIALFVVSAVGLAAMLVRRKKN